MEFSIEDYKKNLAEVVRRYRRYFDLSQVALAERAGVSEKTIVNIETGNYKSLTLTTIQAVTKALGVTVRISLSEGGNA